MTKLHSVGILIWDMEAMGLPQCWLKPIHVSSQAECASWRVNQHERATVSWSKLNYRRQLKNKLISYGRSASHSSIGSNCNGRGCWCACILVAAAAAAQLSTPTNRTPSALRSKIKYHHHDHHKRWPRPFFERSRRSTTDSGWLNGLKDSKRSSK